MLKLLAILKRLFSRRRGPGPSAPDDAPASQWCLVGNIVSTHLYGQENQIKSGSKHFSPGTKVYCFPPQWHDEYATVIVTGIHRGSRKWVTVVMRTSQITNWRAKIIYKPAVLQRLDRGYTIKQVTLSGRWKSKSEVEEWVAELNLREQKVS